jgi:aspartate aminotransferase-like enzyme
VIEANATPRFYFDFVSYRKKMTGDAAQTPYTPAVSALVAQDKALAMIREEGLENVFERHRVLSRAAKEGMKALGLELFGPDDPEANSVTAVKVPEGVDGTKIGKLARDGYFGASDIVVGLATVEMVLAQLGYDVPFGASLAAAERVFLRSEVAL